jgi:hypothetical protein
MKPHPMRISRRRIFAIEPAAVAIAAADQAKPAGIRHRGRQPAAGDHAHRRGNDGMLDLKPLGQARPQSHEWLRWLKYRSTPVTLYCRRKGRTPVRMQSDLLAKIPFSRCKNDLVIAAIHHTTPLIENVAAEQGWKPVIACARRCDFDIQKIRNI